MDMERVRRTACWVHRHDSGNAQGREQGDGKEKQEYQINGINKQTTNISATER